MKSSRPQPGHIYEIEIDRGLLVRIRVIFVSEVFRDVMLVGVLPRSRVLSGGMGTSWTYLFEPIYTDVKGIRWGRWRHIWSSEPLPDDVLLSRRVVAGNIWQGDEVVGLAGPNSEDNPPAMRVYGHRAFLEYLAQRLAALPEWQVGAGS